MTYQPLRFAEDFGVTGNLAAALNSAVEFDNVDGFSTVGFRLKVPTGGAVVFEGSFDGAVWFTITLRSVNTDEFQQTATNDDHYIGSISSVRKFRVRVSVAGSAVGDVVGRVTMDVAMLEGQEFLPPPDKFGQTPIHKDGTFTTIQTGFALWTPAVGKKYVVTDIIVTATGTVDGRLKIFDESDTTGNYLFNGVLDPAVNNSIYIHISLRTPFLSSAIGNKLKVTTTAAVNCSVIAHGYEKIT